MADNALQYRPGRRPIKYEVTLTDLGLSKGLIVWFVMFVATCIGGGIAMAVLNGHPRIATTPTTTVSSEMETTAMITATTPATSIYTTATTTTSTMTTTAEAGECPSEVLILTTKHAASVPIITNAAGKDDRSIDFSIDDDAEVDQSCSIIWNNDLYVYGGNKKKTQISKVTKCRLEKVGTLAFHHSNGDCLNVADEQIYLCFDYWTKKTCRMGSSPIGHFNDITDSNYDHQMTRIATDGDIIIAVGDPLHKNAELLSVNNNTWVDVGAYPSSPIKGSGHSIYQAPIVYVSGAFYVVGGKSKPLDAHESSIGRIDMTTRTWTKAGNLVTGRCSHNIIYDGTYLLVIGGEGTKMSEKCLIENEQVSCTSQTPQLKDYEFYPELHLVLVGYCKALP